MPFYDKPSDTFHINCYSLINPSGGTSEMAATEIRNDNGAVMEREAQEISGKVAQQVSEILEDASQEKKVPRTYLAYRVPSPGVRYYF